MFNQSALNQPSTTTLDHFEKLNTAGLRHPSLYLAWADIYVSGGHIDKARAVLQSGLKYTQNSKLEIALSHLTPTRKISDGRDKENDVANTKRNESAEQRIRRPLQEKSHDAGVKDKSLDFAAKEDDRNSRINVERADVRMPLQEQTASPKMEVPVAVRIHNKSDVSTGIRRPLQEKTEVPIDQIDSKESMPDFKASSINEKKVQELEQLQASVAIPIDVRSLTDDHVMINTAPVNPMIDLANVDQANKNYKFYPMKELPNHAKYPIRSALSTKPTVRRKLHRIGLGTFTCNCRTSGKTQARLRPNATNRRAFITYRIIFSTTGYAF